MNKDLTEIIVLVDESGSMASVRSDTVGGINTFIIDQKNLAAGKARLTLVTFSYASRIKKVIDHLDVNEVELITDAQYSPSGGTALLDAIGLTIDEFEDRYTNEEDESNIPGKVIFAIITDGEENSSKQYTKSKIAAMIKHQTKRHGWEFAFLGANLDAVEEARNIGISSDRSFNFAANAAGVSDSFGVLSSATTAYRSNGTPSYDLKGTSLEGMNDSVAGEDNLNIVGGTIKASDIHVSINTNGNFDEKAFKKIVDDAINKVKSQNTKGTY